MRLALLVLLSLCASACVAKRFLSDDEDIPIVGGYQEIDLKNPPSDYVETLNYVKSHLSSSCKVNGDVKVKGVKKALVQIVAGKNYEIVLKVQNHKSKQLTVKVFQSLPENDQVSYEIDSCV